MSTPNRARARNRRKREKQKEKKREHEKRVEYNKSLVPRPFSMTASEVAAILNQQFSQGMSVGFGSMIGGIKAAVPPMAQVAKAVQAIVQRVPGIAKAEVVPGPNGHTLEIRALHAQPAANIKVEITGIHDSAIIGAVQEAVKIDSMEAFEKLYGKAGL